MFDSPHKSGWLFIYLMVLFRESKIALYLLNLFNFFSLARLTIIIGFLMLIPKINNLKFILLLFLVLLTFLSIFPEKISNAIDFSLAAFDTETNSNTVRYERWEASVQFYSALNVYQMLIGKPGTLENIITMTTESDYLFFLVEYGLIGFSFLVFSLIYIARKCLYRKDFYLLWFLFLISIGLMNTAIRSTGSFYLFMLIILNSYNPNLYKFGNHKQKEISYI